MAHVVAEFFNIVGVDWLPPESLQELIPYILIIVTGVTLVSGVFGVIGRLVSVMLDITKWK